MKLNRRHQLLVVTTLIVLLVGCGDSSSPFASVPVSGKVTYDDGTAIPLPGMKLFFHCLEPPKNGMSPRQALASVGPDGTFKDVTTYKYADGLVPGKHTVAVVAMDGGKYSSKIPLDYALTEKTPLVVEVTQSGQVLEIKVPKPKN